MPGMSIHAFDIARGIPAAGMRVAVRGPKDVLLAEGTVSAAGTFDAPALSARLAPGRYVVAFHVAEFHRASGIALPDVPFLDVARWDFGLADPAQHIHIPFKFTPWGYSCFRGGA